MHRRPWLPVVLGSVLALALVMEPESQTLPTGNSNVSTILQSVHVRGSGSGLATAFRLVGGTFAQLTAADPIEVGSSSAADTFRVLIFGVKQDSVAWQSYVRFQGTTFAASDTTFRKFENAILDSPMTKVPVGTITLRKATGDVTVATIPVGETSTKLAQKFLAEWPVNVKPKHMFFEQWAVNYTGADTAYAELWVFPSWDDTFHVVLDDFAFLPGGTGRAVSTFPIVPSTVWYGPESRYMRVGVYGKVKTGTGAMSAVVEGRH